MNKFFVGLLLAMLPLSMFGCILGGAAPPPMKNYTKVAVAPFEFEKESANMARLTSDIGTMLSLGLKESEWVFDKSEDLQPVADQLTKLSLSPKKIYEEPALAAKIGKALGVDVVIVGRVSNPRIDHKVDDAKYYDMSQQAGISGTTTYTLLKQWATIDVSLKVVDVKSEATVWKKDMLKGYIKYIKAFQAQTPRDIKRPNDEKVVKASMRQHISKRIVHALYPEKFKDKEVPEILEKPDHLNLMKAGGKPIIF